MTQHPQGRKYSDEEKALLTVMTPAYRKQVQQAAARQREANDRQAKRLKARRLLEENGFFESQSGKESIWDSTGVPPAAKPAKTPSTPTNLSKRVGFCHYCERRVKGITRDHIVPKSLIERANRTPRLGPLVVIERNLIDACRPCNEAKADLKSTCDCGRCHGCWDSYYQQTGGYQPSSRGLWVPPRLVPEKEA